MYGILEADAAAELYKKVCKRKGKQMTPIKTQSSSSSSSSAAPKKGDNDNKGEVKKSTSTSNKKAKIIDDSAADTGLEASDAWEGRGTIGV